MRLILVIYAALLTWAVLSAGMFGQAGANYDAALLCRVAHTIHGGSTP